MVKDYDLGVLSGDFNVLSSDLSILCGNVCVHSSQFYLKASYFNGRVTYYKHMFVCGKSVENACCLGIFFFCFGLLLIIIKFNTIVLHTMPSVSRP